MTFKQNQWARAFKKKSYYHFRLLKNYLSDRSGFDALAHIHHYLGDHEQTNRLFETEEFQEMIRLCKHSLIFIILPQRELLVATDDLRIHTDYSDQMKYIKSLKYCYEKATLPYFVIAYSRKKTVLGFFFINFENFFSYEKKPLNKHIITNEKNPIAKSERIKSNTFFLQIFNSRWFDFCKYFISVLFLPSLLSVCDEFELFYGIKNQLFRTNDSTLELYLSCKR